MALPTVGGSGLLIQAARLFSVVSLLVAVRTVTMLRMLFCWLRSAVSNLKSKKSDGLCPVLKGEI